MAIRELITLEGVEDVQKNLKDLNSSGEAALKNFRDLGNASAPSFDKVAQGAKQASAAFNESTQTTHAFRNALHILNPILAETGNALGGLGAFSAAARTGLGGLAAATIGAAAVKLQNIADASTKTKNQLGDLLGGASLGNKAFEQLTTTADQLGISVEKLAPAFRSFVQAQQQAGGTKFLTAPGAEGIGLGTEKATKALTDLFTVLRANHATLDEAAKASEDFGKSVAQSGKVTAQSLSPLQQYPGLFDKIKSALGGAGESNQKFLESFKPADEIQKILRGLGVSGTEADRALRNLGIRAEPSLGGFESALKRIQFQLPKTFDPAAPQSFGEAVEQFLKKLQDVFKPIEPAGGGQGPLTQFTIQAGKDLDAFVATTKQEWNALQELLGKGLEIAPPIVKSVVGDPLKNVKDEFNDIMGLAPKLNQALKEGLDLRQQLLAEPTGEGPLALLNKNIDQTNQDFTLFAEHVNQTLGQPPDLSSWGAGFQAAFDLAVSGAQTAWNSINSALSQPIKLNIDTSSFSGFGGQPLGAPFARGGRVSGPGSSTSDSIMAFLSRGEFVINAAAVDRYGASFFAALNAMRLPRMTGASHFAKGGQVTGAAGTPVHLHFGGQSFSLSATNQAVVKRLRAAAVEAQITSIGRKPGFVR